MVKEKTGFKLTPVVVTSQDWKGAEWPSRLSHPDDLR